DHLRLGNRLREPYRICKGRLGIALERKDAHGEASEVVHAIDDLSLIVTARFVHGWPTRWISHSRLMWVLASTRRRTSSPSASISALVALPRFKRKLQCFSETWAS